LKTDAPGRVVNYEVPIHLDSEEPIKLRQYPLTHEDREEVKREVETMEKNGIISASDSPWNFPIIFVNKKIIDNKGNVKPDRRMCIDLRALNEKSKKINFPIPTVDHTIQNLTGCQYFSSLDVLSGFWHLSMDEPSRRYLSFSTPWNHYSFNVLPFGWVNSPFYFQQFMQVRVANRLPHCVQVYIDDIIIFSKTKDDHFVHLEEVFRVVKEQGLRLKLAKCSFFNEKMEYLGHIISKNGMQKDPKKLRIIEQVEPPRTKKQVRSFLGKINYYAKFMPGLSKAARPLAKLTGTKVAFQWGKEQQQAFQELKGMIIQDVVLAFPDVNKPYHITTDASDYAIGAVLAQEDEQTGVHRPIMYLSKSLDDTQSRFSVTEKEHF
jgi:hypothetical protein